MIEIAQPDEVYIRIKTERGIAQELSDHFTFTVPGHQFMQAYRSRMWDGRIRLFNVNTGKLYAGLLPYVEQFADEREYEVSLDSSVKGDEEFSLQEAKEFVESLQLPYEAKEWQIKPFVHAVRKRRCLLLSPTASGKSLISYMLIKYYEGQKSLIIVPTTSLVAQMYTDFDNYGKESGWRSHNNVHKIMAGQDKQTEFPVVISTWQSLFRMPKKYFQQYDVVIGDECHQFKAKSLTSIMTKLTDTKYRVGMTGTLDGTETHQLVLEGLFGRTKSVITTKELIDKKFLANFEIKAIVLRYPSEICKEYRKAKYQDEIDFLVSSEKRNNFIRNLAVSLNGNTLLLFQYVQKHGMPLFDMIKEKVAKGRKVFFVYGGTNVDQREKVRAIVESEKDAIIVASNGVYSTGIDIKNLHNIIFTHPGKSRIRTLQSIGRGLRKSQEKSHAVLYDIVDDLSCKNYKNFAIKHFTERFSLYKVERFPVKMYRVNLVHK